MKHVSGLYKQNKIAIMGEAHDTQNESLCFVSRVKANILFLFLSVFSFLCVSYQGRKSVTLVLRSTSKVR